MSLINDINTLGSSGAWSKIYNTAIRSPTGDTGLMGSVGLTGDTGKTGDTGLMGNTGPMGLTGNVGELGDTGPTGAGSVVNLFNTGTTGQAGVEGSTFELLIDNNPNYFIKRILVTGGTVTDNGNNVKISVGNTTYTLTDTQTFSSNGTWIKPSEAVLVNILIIGGGGGGGSGGRGSSTSSKTGGGAGYCGAVTYILRYPASNLSSSESVTVGTGGGGGTAQTSDSSDGNDGSAGTESTFDVFAAPGGGGGVGGDNNDISKSQTGTQTPIYYIYYDGSAIPRRYMKEIKQPPSNPTESATDPVTYSHGFQSPVPGGHGGSYDSPDTRTPQASFIQDYYYIDTASAQTAAPAAGNPGTNGGTFQTYYGLGGSGGSATSTIGYAGGNGGNYGSSGGGGGTSSNGNNSGAGGTGAGGVVVVFTYS